MRDIINIIPDEAGKPKQVFAAYRLSIQQPLQSIATKQVHHHRRKDDQQT